MELRGPGTDGFVDPGLDAARRVRLTANRAALSAGPTAGYAETGALFAIAAGNDGPGAQTVRSPGTADDALTAGTVDSADAVAGF